MTLSTRELISGLFRQTKKLTFFLTERDDIKRKENFETFNVRSFRNALKDLLTETGKNFYKIDDMSI